MVRSDPVSVELYSLDPPLRKQERTGGGRFLSRLAGRSLFLSPTIPNVKKSYYSLTVAVNTNNKQTIGS